MLVSGVIHKDSNKATTLLINQSLEAEAKRANSTEAQTPIEETFVPGHPHKSDQNARPKIQSYSQTRRPAGGLSRPLPSPGKI